MVKPKIVGKKKQCLKATITAESGNKVYDEIFDIEIGGLEQSYTKEDEFRLALIKPDEFAATGVNIRTTTPNICTIQRVTPHDLESTLKPDLLDNVVIAKDAANKVSITSKPTDMKIYKAGTEVTVTNIPETEIMNQYLFTYGGFVFKFTMINAGICKIKTQTGTGKDEQEWPLHLELIHPDAQGSCARSTERIFKIGYETDIDKELKVYRKVITTCNRLRDMKVEQRLKDVKFKYVKTGADFPVTDPKTQFVNYSCRPSNYDEDSVIEISTGKIDGESKLCSTGFVCAEPAAAAVPPSIIPGTLSIIGPGPVPIPIDKANLGDKIFIQVRAENVGNNRVKAIIEGSAPFDTTPYELQLFLSGIHYIESVEMTQANYFSPGEYNITAIVGDSLATAITNTSKKKLTVNS